MKKLLMIALLGATVGSAWGASSVGGFAFDERQEGVLGIGHKIRVVNHSLHPISVTKHYRTKPGEVTFSTLSKWTSEPIDLRYGEQAVYSDDDNVYELIIKSPNSVLWGGD